MSFISFLKKHGVNVYLVIWFLFMALIFITIYNVKFHKLKLEEKEENKGYKDKKVMTVMYEGFCDTGKDIAENCAKLKEGGAEACVTQDCCVWAKSDTGEFCVEGTDSGPELNQDHNGKRFEQYYYQKIGKKWLDIPKD